MVDDRLRVPRPGRVPNMVFSGEIVEGVEGGHVVVRLDDGRTCTVSGPARAELVGVSGSVTVRGHVDPELRSTAMQGPVLVVTEVLATEVGGHPEPPTDCHFG